MHVLADELEVYSLFASRNDINALNIYHLEILFKQHVYYYCWMKILKILM